MAILLKSSKLAYVPVPKCACSSLKILCYRLDTGETWHRDRHGVSSIHALPDYESCAFEDSRAQIPSDYQTFAVVRPPIARLISAYQNKLVKERAGTQATLPPGTDLPESFEAFVDRLEELQRGSRLILQHTRPMTYFLGKNPDIYDYIGKMEKMGRLQAWLRDRTGQEVQIRRVNKSGSELTGKDLPPAVRQRLKRMFADDFEFLARVNDAARARQAH